MLTDEHRKVLLAMAYHASAAPFHYMGFAPIAAESGLPKRRVRQIVRHFARKGYAEFASGLWSEDGEPRGSGYCITPAGLAALEGSDD